MIVSDRTRLLFVPNQSSLFLLYQPLLEFQTCLSFSEANGWALKASFSKLSFEEISL